MRMLLALALALLPSCKKDPPPRQEQSQSPHEDKSQEVSRPTKGAHQKAPATHIILVSHGPKEAEAQMIAVPIDHTKPESKPWRVNAVPHARWPEHHRMVVGVGSNLVVHAAQRNGKWLLERRSLDEAPSPLPPISLEVDDVSALMVTGSKVIVGAGMRVGVVDLDNAKPTFTELASHPDVSWKAYDVLARDGSLVVAIDDVVTPIWADLLSLDGGGKHLAPWTMPSFINGTYKLAAVHFDDKEKQNGTLYTIADYGIISGSGHDLIRLAIEGGELKIPENVIANSRRLEDPPVLEEHVDRGSGKVEKIIHGEEVTPWTGLGLLFDTNGKVSRVAIAAGERGLLLVTANFTPDSKAEAFDLGGRVLDVANIGGELVALVSPLGQPVPGRTDLLWLEASAERPGIKVKQKSSVTGAGYNRIVRSR